MNAKLKKQLTDLLKKSTETTLNERIDFINELREIIHEYSPFKNEPLDYRDTMLRITRKPPDQVIYKKLSKIKQKLFKELCEIEGNEYTEKLKQIKRWSRD